MPVLIDSYELGSAGSSGLLYNINSNAFFQTFTVGGSGDYLYSAKFWLSKAGSPSGNVTYKLYAISGTPGSTAIPSGSALATSDNLVASTLTTTSTLTEILFTGVNSVFMTPGNYAISVEYNGGDASNNVIVSHYSTTNVDPGNSGALYSGAWSYFTTDDLSFYVYAVDPTAPGYVVIDKFSGTANSTTLIGSGVFVAAAQVFSVSRPVTLTRLVLGLSRSGSPPGSFTVRIYTAIGTPGVDAIQNTMISTGTVLATSLSTSSSAIQPFTITPLYLVPGNYVLSIEYTGGSFGNSLQLQSDTPAVSNKNAYTTDTSAVRAQQSSSYYFFAYGNLVMNTVHSVDTNLRVQPDTTTYSFVYPGGWGMGYVGQDYGGLGSTPFVFSYLKTYTLDTFKKKRLTRTHTLDTFKRKTNTRTHTLDTFKKKTNTRTHTLDTLIKSRLLRTHTLDTLLKKSATKIHTVDTFLVKRTIRTHTVDTILRKTYLKTHTVDTILRTTRILSHTLDTYMYKPGANKFHTVDTLLRKIRSVSHTLDTLLSRRFTRTHTLDTFLVKRILKTHTIDSIFKKRYTRTHTLDTILKKRFTKTHTLDTLLKKNFIRIHTLDTFLKKRFTKLHTIDTFLRKTNTRTHTLDTVLRRSFTKTHTLDTFLKRGGIRTHTIDAVFWKRATKSHTLDTVLFKPKSVSHTIDTIFRFSQGDIPIINTLQDNSFANIIEDNVVIHVSSEKPKFSSPDYKSPVELIIEDKPRFR